MLGVADYKGGALQYMRYLTLDLACEKGTCHLKLVRSTFVAYFPRWDPLAREKPKDYFKRYAD